MTDDIEKQREAAKLEEAVDEAANLADRLGLDPYPVNYWVVDYDEMNELIAYGGFQKRYPHWRWGMQYDRQQKQSQFLGGKAFEIVNNDSPAHAFLQVSNSVADQKAVITHVEAHSDFFANNQWFGMFDDDPNAAAMLGRHADTVREYMQDPDIERAEVEKWIDHVLCLEDNIDQYEAYAPVSVDESTPEPDSDLAGVDEQLDDLELSDEVRQQVFDDEWLDAQSDDDEPVSFPEDPDPDVIGFLRKHGMAYDEDAGKATEMTEWQAELLEILRAEAYYFAPQKMSKVMNEGWACVAPDTPVFTTHGLVPMAAVVSDRTAVSDGETDREVYDSTIIEDHDTVSIETRRGFELTGSNNHRVRRPEGSWVRLDELDVGDRVEITGGAGIWPDEYVPIEWENPGAIPLGDAAETARVPGRVTEQVGRFLGLLIGDGHLPSNSHHVGFTSGSEARAEEFAGLLEELFGVSPAVEEQDSGWRVDARSETLRDLLVGVFDLPTGTAAGRKTVPQQVSQSPRPVVAEFLRGLFDADGSASDQGAVLATESESLSRTVQLLLANFGILTSRREQDDGCHSVRATGDSARRFADEIGFGYPEKAGALETSLEESTRFEDEDWTDEVVAVEEGTGTVHDISVRETHRYAGAGFLNHNSKWESMMMADENFAGADEFVTYADHMSRVLASPGLNPYKLGLELWQYVENTENRRHVAEHLLRVEGITWRNFHDTIDFEEAMGILDPDPVVASVDPEGLDEVDPADPRIDADSLAAARADEVDVERYPWKLFTYEGLCERHYSLTKPQNRGFLGRIGQEELERISRYMFDDARYGSVEAALSDVDYTVGWDRMREVRESHNDVTFLDEFLTQEFVDEHDYFTYEYMQSTDDYRATSTDVADVKKKLMLQFTNFGKPTVVVADGNYDNRNELLLEHQYNGVALDIEQAKSTLERVFELWGRPVNLHTIVKQFDEHDVEVARRRDREPEPEEQGLHIRYDGMDFAQKQLDRETVEHLAATDVDYDTKPDEWLA
ncbi:MAG: SpoVR family protein [Salinirussus sp.]